MTLRQSLLYIAASATLLLSSCGTSRRAVGSDNSVGASEISKCETLLRSYNEWKVVSMPVKVSLTAPTSVSMSGRLYMERGSLVNVSLRLLGMEVGVVRIMPDSIYCLDKFNRIALVEPTAQLLKRYDLSFEALQEIMLGRPAIPSQGVINQRNLTRISIAREETGELVVSPRRPDKNLEWHYVVSPDCLGLQQFEVTLQGTSLTVDYGRSEQTVVGPVTTSSSARAQVGRIPVAVTIDYSVGSLKTDASRPSWKTPDDSYRRVDAASLFKLIRK